MRNTLSNALFVIVAAIVILAIIFLGFAGRIACFEACMELTGSEIFCTFE